MDNTCVFYTITKELSWKQKNIIKLLYLSSQEISKFIHVKGQLSNLQDANLVEIKDNEVCLTELGTNVVNNWNKDSNFLSSSDQEKLSKRIQEKQSRIEKSNHFLELYREGLTYQNIGDRYSHSWSSEVRCWIDDAEFNLETI